MLTRSLDQTLRLRIAQIELARGNTQTALDQLWEIVEDAPDCLPAWDLLAGSYRDLANVEQELRVAQNLTRLDPNRAEAWVFLGSIQRERGETEAATAAFERAIELEPRDPASARELFLLYLSEDDTDKAEEVLERFAPFVPYHELLIGEVLLRSQQKNLNAALASFRESCRSHLVAPGDAIAAIDALISCGGKDEARQVMEAEILRGTASSGHARRVGRSLCQRGKVGGSAPRGSTATLPPKVSGKQWRAATLNASERRSRGRSYPTIFGRTASDYGAAHTPGLRPARPSAMRGFLTRH